MQISFKRVSGWEPRKVEFYSVCIDDQDKTEFDLFFDNDFSNHRQELGILGKVLKNISQRGAKSHYFKHERAAEALPIIRQTIIETLDNADYGIRLYCIRLTDCLVILLNGGIKTKLDPEQCPNVSRHFKLANRISTKINREIESRDLNLSVEGSLDEYYIEI